MTGKNRSGGGGRSAVRRQATLNATHDSDSRGAGSARMYLGQPSEPVHTPFPEVGRKEMSW